MEDDEEAIAEAAARAEKVILSPLSTPDARIVLVLFKICVTDKHPCSICGTGDGYPFLISHSLFSGSGCSHTVGICITSKIPCLACPISTPSAGTVEWFQCLMHHPKFCLVPMCRRQLSWQRGAFRLQPVGRWPLWTAACASLDLYRCGATSPLSICQPPARHLL